MESFSRGSDQIRQRKNFTEKKRLITVLRREEEFEE
jgi:hypothetical protein